MLACSGGLDQLGKSPWIEKLLQGLGHRLRRWSSHGRSRNGWDSRRKVLRRRYSRFRRKRRNLVADKPELILSQLLALQYPLKVQKRLESLLHGRIKRIVGKVASGRRDQCFDILVQGANVNNLLLLRLRSRS